MWSREAGAHFFHVGAWACWLAAAMFAALSTRNPFYLVSGDRRRADSA